jgi:hypothetical protein
MLKIEKVETVGWEAATRGMRNPMNSWKKSDSFFCGSPECCFTDDECNPGCAGYGQGFNIGEADLDLMTRLRNSGTDHRKFMRMITVYLDITAPLYWWKEFKTYRAGRKFGDDEPSIVDEGYLEYDIEMNSCSTMHKIASKEFTLDDFSHEHLLPTAKKNLESTIDILNGYRDQYSVDTNPELKKEYWWQMIQLLPSSYNQRRTVMLNYEVLANIYKSRRNHKLDEWHTFCDWIEDLPYSELITGKENN